MSFICNPKVLRCYCLVYSIPVLAVIGHKNSGKTTVLEGLVVELKKEGFNVASAKHVSKKDFTFDIEGKNSWRHSKAGANPVILVSDNEVVVKIRDGISTVSLGLLMEIAVENGAHVLVLEGFSDIVLKDKKVGKIICIRNKEEYDEYTKRTEGQILGFCSIKPFEEKILNTKDSILFIMKNVISFIEKTQKTIEIHKQLAGLDCRRCGKTSCWELAESIFNEESKLEDCFVLEAKSKLKTMLKVGNTEVPLQPFVAEIIQKTILGLVSTLKGVKIKGDEKIYINIT